MNTEFAHCCDQMARYTQDPRLPINYYPLWRAYSLKLLDSKVVVQGIFYCPWCGTKLPSSVRDEYFDILEKECGITDHLDPEQQRRIPAEFTTDAWWKKRGL